MSSAHVDTPLITCQKKYRLCLCFHQQRIQFSSWQVMPTDKINSFGMVLGFSVFFYQYRKTMRSIRTIPCILLYAMVVSLPGISQTNTVSYISNGNIIHNQKAIFPIGYWMEYNPIAEKEKALEVLGAAGFDMITYGVQLSDKQRMIALFDKAKSYNMRVMYGLYGSGNVLGTGQPSPTEDWVLKDDGIPIRNNTALISYYHTDDVNRFNPADLVAKNNLVKNIDPTRLTAISASFANIQFPLADYMDGSDMPADQIYPITNSFLHNAYTGARRIVVAANAKGKSPAIYSQTHNLADFGIGTNQRMPTPRELDVMTYLNVAAGIKSLWFYTYGASGKTAAGGLDQYSPAIWQKSIQIKNELRRWEKVFLFGKHFAETDITAGSANFTSYQGHWIYGDKVYVIVSNSWQNDIRGDRSKFISINLPEGTSGPITPFSNQRNQTLTIQNNILSGNIDYYDVQLYELTYKKPTVINGDFAADFFDWTKSNDATIMNEAGNKFLKAGSATEVNSVIKDITHRIIPGTTYTFSADTKSKDPNSNVMVFIQFRDYQNKIILQKNIFATTPNFENKSVEFTSPDEFGAVSIGVWRNTPSTADVYVDNINILPGRTGTTITNNIDTKDDFIIGPNPTHGIISIRDFRNIQSLSVYDMQGRLQKNFVNNIKETLDFSGWPNGSYVLSATLLDGKVVNRQLIIQR
jgi:hypothetical protein